MESSLQLTVNGSQSAVSTGFAGPARKSSGMIYSQLLSVNCQLVNAYRRFSH